MATTTTNYSFTLPEVGGDTDQWGAQLNANWTLADTTLKTIADSVGDDVTLTGNDYLTISGQAITVGDVDLATDVTGTLPVGSGGTGLASLGTANQVLAVNSGGTALEFQTISGSGTVTSVSVTGSDGIEVDSGSPITTSGTIALGVNAITLSTHLGLGSLATQSSVTESQISDFGTYQAADAGLTSIAGLTTAADKMLYTTASDTYAVADLTAAGRALLDDADADAQRTTLGLGVLATQSTITESQISDLGSYITASSTDTLTNKSGAISQWTNDSGYLTAETNDLTASVTWTNVPDVNITQSSVTQHQAALTITESQISDLQNYLTAETNDLGSAVTGTLPIANGGTGETSASAARIALLPSLGTAGQVLAVNTGSTDVEWVDASAGGGSGTVTSVAISGTDGIEVDSGSPITTSGTIALGINAATLSSHLSLGTAATTASTDYATAAQGSLADSAVQPGDNLNTLGSGSELAGKVIRSDGSGGAAWYNLTVDLPTEVASTLQVANGGTGVTSLGSLNAADLGSGAASDGYVLTADGAGGAAWEAASGGGGGTTAYLEHSSTISDSFTVTSGNNRMYIGGTTFSGTITVAGRLAIVAGPANFTGTINVTGTLVTV